MPDHDFGPSGHRLWSSITDRFDLDAHEEVVLVEAARTCDILDELDRIVEADGHMVDGRLHPAVVEARQQKLALARLIASLRLPDDEDADLHRPQRRGGARRPQRFGVVS